MDSPVKKPFDQKLFDDYDQQGCDTVKRFVRNVWNIEAHTFLKYQVDLIMKSGESWVGFIEVEVRNWGGGLCPFDTIHIAQRKAKLLKNGMPTVMFVVSSGGKYGYYCDAGEILDSPLVEIGNKYVKSGEYFYDVPIDKFILVDLTNGDFDD
jgi:hypothetical protein